MTNRAQRMKKRPAFQREWRMLCWSSKSRKECCWTGQVRAVQWGTLHVGRPEPDRLAVEGATCFQVKVEPCDPGHPARQGSAPWV